MLGEEWIEPLLEFFKKDASEEEFNEMALRLFAYQYQHNLAYQRFCQNRGKTLRTVKHYKEIPGVPITGFKELTLSVAPPEDAKAVFMTSGTTNPEKRGKHYHPTLEVYDASMRLNFKNRVMGSFERIRMGILFPHETDLPNSSLAHYLTLAFTEFGSQESHYLVGEDGIDFNRLFAELSYAEKSGEPYALLGATFSFIHLLDQCEAENFTFRLPEGSFVLDTGGVKGKSREMVAEIFYQKISEKLGVPRSKCISMYGMTELSTQFYDNGNAVTPSVKSGPHWIRTRVVDPITGQEVPKGQTGVLAHCDVANFNSVTTLLTEDAGIEVEGGFLLLGRVQGAEAKGCSLAVEEFLRSAKGPSR